MTLLSTEVISKEKNEGSTPKPKGRVDPDKSVFYEGQTKFKMQTRYHYIYYECLNNQRRP